MYLIQCFVQVCCAVKVWGVTPEAKWLQQVHFPVLVAVTRNVCGAEMLIFKLHKHGINIRTLEFKEKDSESSSANLWQGIWCSFFLHVHSSHWLNPKTRNAVIAIYTPASLLSDEHSVTCSSKPFPSLFNVLPLNRPFWSLGDPLPAVLVRKGQLSLLDKVGPNSP